MTGTDILRELELLAYVDGLLDGDPLRKAQVEARLAASPAEAERARAYRRQTAALRQRYGGRVGEPVPERLYRALERPDRRRFGGFWRAAAAAVALLAVGLAGWAVGQRGPAPEPAAEAFLARSLTGFFSRPGEGATEAALRTRAAPATLPADRISLSLRVPDLRAAGYTVAGRQRVGGEDEQLIRLTYEAEDGRSFDLFLRPRWHDPEAGMRTARRGEVSLAYWFDGPLAHAVVSRLSREETRELALTVRRALRDPETAAPAVHLSPPPGHLGLASKHPVPLDGDVLPLVPSAPRDGVVTAN